MNGFPYSRVLPNVNVRKNAVYDIAFCIKLADFGHIEAAYYKVEFISKQLLIYTTHSAYPDQH